MQHYQDPNCEDSSPRQSSSIWLALLGMCCGGIVFFCSREDYVAASVAGAITFAGLSGYRVGAARLIAFFCGILVAMLVAPGWGRVCEPYLGDWFGTVGITNRTLAMGIVGTAVVLVITITTQISMSFITRDRPLLKAMNQWIGFAIGTSQGIALVLLLMGGILSIEPIAQDRLDSDQPLAREQFGQDVAGRIIEIASLTRQSAVRPLIEQNNPFVQIDSLRGSLQAFSDPERFAAITSDLPLQDSNPSSSIQRSVLGLIQDLEVRKFLEKGHPESARE